MVLAASIGALAFYVHRVGRLRSAVRAILRMLPYYLLVMLVLAAYQFYLAYYMPDQVR